MRPGRGPACQPVHRSVLIGFELLVHGPLGADWAGRPGSGGVSSALRTDGAAAFSGRGAAGRYASTTAFPSIRTLLADALAGRGVGFLVFH